MGFELQSTEPDIHLTESSRGTANDRVKGFLREFGRWVRVRGLERVKVRVLIKGWNLREWGTLLNGRERWVWLWTSLGFNTETESMDWSWRETKLTRRSESGVKNERGNGNCLWKVPNRKNRRERALEAGLFGESKFLSQKSRPEMVKPTHQLYILWNVDIFHTNFLYTFFFIPILQSLIQSFFFSWNIMCR